MLLYDIVFDTIYVPEESEFFPDLTPFKKEVNHRIGEGWRPLGGHCITKYSNNFAIIAQTMVKDV